MEADDSVVDGSETDVLAINGLKLLLHKLEGTVNGTVFLHQLAEEDTMLLGDQLGLMASVFAIVCLPCGVYCSTCPLIVVLT